MDFNKAMLLLHVAEKAQGWPSLSKLRDAALAELHKLQDGKPAPEAPSERKV